MAQIVAEAEGPSKGRGLIPQIDLETIRKSPALVPGLVVLGVILFAFWNLFERLPKFWFDGDGYYSHGALVPLISGYIVYRWWPRLKDIPVRPFALAAVPLALTGWLLFAGVRVEQIQVLSLSLVFTILFGVWFVAGGRWTLALAGPIFYLMFGLPIWSHVIDTYTNPLQVISTDVSYALLQLMNFRPYQYDSTTIHLANFTLDVGVPCSGLKLVIAVSAFTVFFMMIAQLKWWGNLMMVLAVLPLCLFINGLRIALIGIVGDMYGADAGMQFHDYSGYITLLICFFLLFKLARLLGWND